MSQKQPNDSMSFSSFADWCRHIDDLSAEARYTVKVLLEKAGTYDPQAAQQILSSMTELDLGHNQIIDISALRSLTNLRALELENNQITALCVLGLLAQKRLTLSTRLIEAQKATEAVKVAYATIGLKEPSVIICSSPRDVCLQIFNLFKHDYSQNYCDEYSNRLGKNLDRKWMSPVGEFASPGVWKYELDRMKMEPEADSTMRELMYELVYSYIRSEGRTGNLFRAHFYPQSSLETPTTLFKEIYLTQLYISSGVNISQKAQEILCLQKLLFEHCGWIIPFEKICYVCDRPRHLRFDSQNRLHAEGEPAIEFPDGWNFYYYRDVRLPEEYGKLHPSQWQSQWLLTEENAELRRVLIQGIGYERMIQELSATQIDSWQEYALLQIDDADQRVTPALERSERRLICPDGRGSAERATDKSVPKDVFRCVRSTVDRDYHRMGDDHNFRF